jgi:hypothetical protein
MKRVDLVEALAGRHVSWKLILHQGMHKQQSVKASETTMMTE